MNPSYCEVNYSVEITPVVNEQGVDDTAVTKTGDKTFDFEYSKDSAPVDGVPSSTIPPNQVQTVTIKATSADSKFLAVTGDAAATPKEYEEDFDVTFLDPCQNANFITLTLAAQNDPPSDDYSDITFFFNYATHTVSPAWCDVQITCNSVAPTETGVPCQNIVNDQISWEFGETEYKSGDAPPGIYVFTYDVSVNGQVTEQFNFNLELTDPCAAAVVGST